ncbi:hypothetical protein ZIOFF_068403 [Zingiber officinale]|uniref:Uncharacterized protein n=1 Tax=Zingiber officinale TaxID=94328 RepID=A0A8J5EVM3_ZINOF|nr:hypothetical protein ZIOFF_068403 [Zingiber officinale]
MLPSPLLPWHPSLRSEVAAVAKKRSFGTRARLPVTKATYSFIKILLWRTWTPRFHSPRRWVSLSSPGIVLKREENGVGATGRIGLNLGQRSYFSSGVDAGHFIFRQKGNGSGVWSPSHQPPPTSLPGGGGATPTSPAPSTTTGTTRSAIPPRSHRHHHRPRPAAAIVPAMQQSLMKPRESAGSAWPTTIAGGESLISYHQQQQPQRNTTQTAQAP